MTMNIFTRVLSSLHVKHVTKEISSKCLRQKTYPLCRANVFFYSSQPPSENNVENEANKSIKADKIPEMEQYSNLSSFRKRNMDSLIEPTQYYNPDLSDKINFEERFWNAYEENLKKEKQDMDIFPERIRYRKVYDNPLHRTFGILRDDILEYFGRLKRNPLVYIRNPTLETRIPKEDQIFPHYCDIVIIGGGIVGTSIAFHLQEKARDGLRVVVVEKDMSYSMSSTVLSVGGIRQQFSTPENIILSKYGMDFLQQADTRLAVKGHPPPNVDLTFSGYLTLASEEGYHQLQENYEVQKLHGSFVELLSKDKLKSRFPWLNVEGVEAGVYGVQREGWFDPWSFLIAMSRKAKSLGTEYVNGTVIDCSFKPCGERISIDKKDQSSMKQVRSIQVKLPDGETREIHCALCVIAAGAWSKDVGKIFGIGNDVSGYNSIPIPVEPRKRYVYCVKSPNGPNLNCPLVIDTNGTYFRREGLADLYLCGRAPSPEEEPSNDDLSVDYDFFENTIWPVIAHRCPSFESLKVHSAWAGYYDYNSFDQNAIVGHHPLFTNLFISAGFSGHGIQQAAGAGCAISELILDADYKTINLEKFGFERILTFNPVLEKCCY